MHGRASNCSFWVISLVSVQHGRQYHYSRDIIYPWTTCNNISFRSLIYSAGDTEFAAFLLYMTKLVVGFMTLKLQSRSFLLIHLSHWDITQIQLHVRCEYEEPIHQGPLYIKQKRCAVLHYSHCHNVISLHTGFGRHKISAINYQEKTVSKWLLHVYIYIKLYILWKLRT